MDNKKDNKKNENTNIVWIPFLWGRESFKIMATRYLQGNKNFICDYLDEFTHFTNVLIIVGPVTQKQKEYLRYIVSHLATPGKVYYFNHQKEKYHDEYFGDNVMGNVELEEFVKNI